MMPLLRIVLPCLALALLPAAALAQARPTPKDAMLYIMYPEDGASVKSPFLCRFGLRNMGVAPAGHDFPNTGHHHLMIDTDEAINPDEPIPHDKNHLHFGGGETEVQLDLRPGKHTLQLVLGDGNHFSFTPPLLSKKITITVRGDSDGDGDRVKTRSRHRSHHRTHRTHSDRHHAESKPNKDGHESCGFWGWLKGCQEAVSTPAKPPAPPPAPPTPSAPPAPSPAP